MCGKRSTLRWHRYRRRLVPKYEVEHHYTLGGMVEAGLGITALPSMAFSMLSQPMLRILPITKSPVVREIGILKVRGKKLTLCRQRWRLSRILKKQ